MRVEFADTMFTKSTTDPDVAVMLIVDGGTKRLLAMDCVIALVSSSVHSDKSPCTTNVVVSVVRVICGELGDRSVVPTTPKNAEKPMIDATVRAEIR